VCSDRPRPTAKIRMQPPPTGGRRSHSTTL
jgi:hypothetical protein